MASRYTRLFLFVLSKFLMLVKTVFPTCKLKSNATFLMLVEMEKSNMQVE
jgi:hypothetical protein